MSKQQGVLRPLSLRQRSVAVALGLTAAAIAAPAIAQDSQNEEVELDTLKIEDRTADVNPHAEPGAPYKARTSGDERLTRPIAELPQTISVLTETQIRESGYTDLVRILDAQPGITVGTGENGNAFGDRYIIRGQEARSDVFVDGLRDPGMTIRESFAVDQVEISKGPNSSFAGRGTAGGAINAITKQATTDYDFVKASVGLGSDRYARATADVNLAVSDDFAVRANVLYGYQEIPDRGPTDRERKGLAVSAKYAPTDDFSFTLDYYGLRADDLPDVGGYLDGDLKPVEAPVYAQKQDFLKSDVDTVTGRIDYSFSPNARIVNLTRYGSSNNAYVLTGARGTTTDESDPNGSYSTITFSTHQGWQDVDYFANQTNLFIDSEMLGGENNLIIGAEYTNHKVVNGVYNVASTGDTNCIVSGRGGVSASYCGIGPDGLSVNGLDTLLGREISKGSWDQDWKIETVSGYVMDTLDLTSRLTVFAGLRLDHYNFHLRTVGRDSTITAYKDSDTLWNGHFGVTYKVGGGGMIYASFASAADINGGESDVGTNGGYGGFIAPPEGVSAKPERSWNYEIGTKWNVFGEKLLLTAAVFQTDKKDVMESLSGEDYSNLGTLNTGGNRVRGVELGFAGNVTPQWSVQGGVTWMDSEVTKSYTPENVGKMLANFAKFQAQFQTRYQVTDRLAVGLAVKHKSKRYGGQPDTAAPYVTNTDGSFYYQRPVPAYTVGDAFVEYKFNKNLDFRLNVNNFTNEDYYLAVYRGGFFLYKGDARQIVGTLNLRF
ncbi:MAG: TonB-dependent receptor [Novosphingobium sp.]|nr:TonB-dependent receptor [Novosphingobium sp.]